MTYIGPTTTTKLPRNLSLTQFVQTVLTGISELPGTLVRPEWQPNPPKQPEIDVDWMAFGIGISKPDANAYQVINDDGSTTNQRTDELEITCSIYGPRALETYGLVRDGFQVQPNLYALYNAQMAFKEVTEGRRIPDLINERFFNRVTTSIFLRRLVQRTYSVLTILSVTGKAYVPDVSEDYFINFNAA